MFSKTENKTLKNVRLEYTAGSLGRKWLCSSKAENSTKASVLFLPAKTELVFCEKDRTYPYLGYLTKNEFWQIYYTLLTENKLENILQLNDILAEPNNISQFAQKFVWTAALRTNNIEEIQNLIQKTTGSVI